MSNADLREQFGRIFYRFSGYDDCTDELYAIPEVRRYLRRWHELQPYWLFFGSFEDATLKLLYLALLDSVDCFQFSKEGVACACFDLHTMTTILAEDLDRADQLCERIGVSPAKRLQRAKQALHYFGLEGPR
ncbi:MAG: hypothetical protein IPN11_15330 [Opitutaceae bacterium]|nr:hypothetical protein [Opitutaceae bacterium]